MVKNLSRTGVECPVCSQGHLTSIVGTRDVEYKGHAGKVDVHYAKCDFCESELTNDAESLANARSLCAFHKKMEGLLSGQEIKEFREHYHITQADAALLFGGGKVAFSRYENNDVIQSSPMDSLIYLCMEDAHNLLLLAKKRKLKLSPKTLEVIESQCVSDLGTFASSYQKKIDKEFKKIFDYAPFRPAANDSSLTINWVMYEEESVVPDYIELLRA